MDPDLHRDDRRGAVFLRIGGISRIKALASLALAGPSRSGRQACCAHSAKGEPLETGLTKAVKGLPPAARTAKL